MKSNTQQRLIVAAAATLVFLADAQSYCRAAACEKCEHRNQVLTIELHGAVATYATYSGLFIPLGCSGAAGDCGLIYRQAAPSCDPVYDSIVCNMNGPSYTGTCTVYLWNGTEYIVDPESSTTYTVPDCADACESGCTLP